MNKKLLGLCLAIFLVNFVSASALISECKNITSPGEYTLASDLVSDTTCLRIYADNVFIDGNSKTIFSNSQGIDIFNTSTVLIKNLNIQGPKTGIMVLNSDVIHLESINFKNQKIGLSVGNSNNVYLNNLFYQNVTKEEFFYNSNFIDVPIVPEFSLIIGSLTIASAVVLFFVIRRK